MNNLELLKKAIQLQKPISYEYNAPDRAVGLRFGNPHAIFISTSRNINIHIYKTNGVKTDPTKPLPDWREYIVKYITNITILVGHASFKVANGYNPNSKMYSRVIAKI